MHHYYWVQLYGGDDLSHMVWYNPLPHSPEEVRVIATEIYQFASFYYM